MLSVILVAPARLLAESQTLVRSIEDVKSDTTNVQRIKKHTVKLLGKEKDLDALHQLDLLVLHFESIDNQEETKFYNRVRRQLRTVFRQSSRLIYKPDTPSVRKRKSAIAEKRKVVAEKLLNHK